MTFWETGMYIKPRNMIYSIEPGLMPIRHFTSSVLIYPFARQAVR